MSLPLWECGLKLADLKRIGVNEESLPLWECGLKFSVGGHLIFIVLVTPLVGVWIEMNIFL